MSGFRFESAEYLNGIWFVVIGYLLLRYYFFQLQKKAQSKLNDRHLSLLTQSVSLHKRRWKMRLEIMVLIFLILGYARLQFPEGKQEVKNEGIEIVFLVDVSNSMMAEDIKPSRLQLAKSELTRFVDMSSGDRLALVAFAGAAALLSPMTTDKEAIKMYIDSLDASVVSSQGTDFSKAFDVAMTAFEQGGLGEQEGAQVTRAIVILSDGEDHEDGAFEKIEKLHRSGVFIFTLGFGTEQGGAIPVRDEQGVLRGYKRGSDGQVILSKTKGEVLKKIASQGKGSFHHVTFQGDAMRAIRSDIEELKKTQFESGEVRSYDEKFQWFLIVALILACAEILVTERKKLGRIWKGRFEVALD